MTSSLSCQSFLEAHFVGSSPEIVHSFVGFGVWNRFEQLYRKTTVFCCCDHKQHQTLAFPAGLHGLFSWMLCFVEVMLHNVIIIIIASKSMPRPSRQIVLKDCLVDMPSHKSQQCMPSLFCFYWACRSPVSTCVRLLRWVLLPIHPACPASAFNVGAFPTLANGANPLHHFKNPCQRTSTADLFRAATDILHQGPHAQASFTNLILILAAKILSPAPLSAFPVAK